MVDRILSLFDYKSMKLYAIGKKYSISDGRSSVDGIHITHIDCYNLDRGFYPLFKSKEQAIMYFQKKHPGEKFFILDEENAQKMRGKYPSSKHYCIVELTIHNS